ncbi:MAG: AtpZ/AtpI family protein [Methylomonas sp.]|jgi:ATP synthase protein I
MLKPSPGQTPAKQEDLAEQVGGKAKRKLKALRHPTPGIWFGLGMMGLIGWSVVLPTLLGAGLGLWLDRHYEGAHSWTLALLMAGLVIGCFNAWQWIAKEHQAIQAEERENDNDD